jgi:hypothetical protein
MTDYKKVRVEIGVYKLLIELSNMCGASRSDTVEALIRDEYARLVSSPNPPMTIEEAEAKNDR